jgi:hypothetical protein
MPIRIDKVIFSTLHESYKNYDTVSSTISISGTVANGATANFTATLAYARTGTRADVYLDGHSTKVLANAGDRATSDVYQFISSETFATRVVYSITDITVTISIFNGTGGPISLTSQTIVVSAVLYDAPITAIS